MNPEDNDINNQGNIWDNQIVSTNSQNHTKVTINTKKMDEFDEKADKKIDDMLSKFDFGDAKGDITKGWSWGGSLFVPLVLIGARKWVMLVIYFVLGAIVVINFFSLIGFFIYGGLKGKELILGSSKTFDSREQAIGALKLIELAGKIMLIVLTVMLIVAVLYFLFFSVLIRSIFMGS